MIARTIPPELAAKIEGLHAEYGNAQFANLRDLHTAIDRIASLILAHFSGEIERRDARIEYLEKGQHYG